MRVWIDQDLCTGDGLCLDHCPTCSCSSRTASPTSPRAAVALNDPGGSGSLAWVPRRLEQDVIDAALACPGECIFIELDRVSAA